MNEKIETQKFIMNRLDTYIDSSQNKSNLYLTLNTIISGGVIALISVKTGSCILNILLVVIALLSIVSILITLKAINPYLQSNKNGKKSIFFFKDISQNKKDEYLDIVYQQKEGELLKDITEQTYYISKGLNTKYKLLGIVGWIVAFEFILLFAWIIIYLLKLNS